GRAEARERVVGLEPEHHADGEPAHRDDDEREHAQLVELVHERAHARRRAHDRLRDARREDPEATEVVDEAEHESPQIGDRAHDARTSAPSPAVRKSTTSRSAPAASARGSPSTARSGSSSTIQSAMRMVDGTSCDTTTIVMPYFRLTSSSTPSMRRVEIGSRP